MTITPTMLYWILMLDNIRLHAPPVFGIFAFLTICGIAGHIGYCISNKKKKSNTLITILSFVASLFIIISISTGILLPNTKQMATILVAPKLINSSFVQEDLPKEAKELYGMAKSYLKEQITETKEK